MESLEKSPQARVEKNELSLWRYCFNTSTFSGLGFRVYICIYICVYGCFPLSRGQKNIFGLGYASGVCFVVCFGVYFGVCFEVCFGVCFVVLGS